MKEQTNLNAEAILNAPHLAIDQLGTQIGSSLILAPHPDDEALGCGGMICYLRSQNIAVSVCFITSGGASHLNSKTHPQNTLTALREKEAINSCEILGVDVANIHFLRQQDGQLNRLKADENKEIAYQISILLDQYEITSLFLPWRRDPHLDHIASYKIGVEASKLISTSLQIIEYPIWLWKNSKKEDWPQANEIETFRLNIQPVFEIKKKAIFAHASQTLNLITDDSEGFQLTDDLLSPFLTPNEVFFFATNKKSESLSKAYFDNLYSNNPDPWNFVGSDYERSKYEKIDSFLENRRYVFGLELGCSIGIQTRLLSTHCQNLLAIDISDTAINTAKEVNADLNNVVFEVKNVIDEFPIGPFDFISMCEIGYFLAFDDLKILFEKMTHNLEVGGQILLVHWTSYVREFPLTGRQVHQIFEDYNTKNQNFKRLSFYVHESYELMLWEKI